MTRRKGTPKDILAQSWHTMRTELNASMERISRIGVDMWFEEAWRMIRIDPQAQGLFKEAGKELVRLELHRHNEQPYEDWRDLHHHINLEL
jgi:hypothetical protein